jgi:hypothetical protein
MHAPAARRAPCSPKLCKRLGLVDVDTIGLGKLSDLWHGAGGC